MFTAHAAGNTVPQSRGSVSITGIQLGRASYSLKTNTQTLILRYNNVEIFFPQL